MNKTQIKKDEKYMAKFCRVKEAAKILNVTRNTVYNRVKDGRLNVAEGFIGSEDTEALFYRAQVEALARKG